MRPITRSALGAILALMETVEGFVAMLAYAGVAALLITDVVMREFLGIPILGAQSLAVLGAIIAGFLGLSLAAAKGMHLRPAVLDHVLPARFDPYIARSSDVIASVFYFAIAYFAVRFVGESQLMGDKAAVLYFPLWPIQLVMPYAFLSCAIRHAAYAVEPELKITRQTSG